MVRGLSHDRQGVVLFLLSRQVKLLPLISRLYTGGQLESTAADGRGVEDKNMPSLYEILRQDSEAVPGWLERLQPGDAFDHLQFFSSRVVFYPGSGTDGHPVKVFGSTHAAHCFVYADYSVPQRRLQAELSHSTDRFRGYTTFARIPLAERDIAPHSLGTTCPTV